MLVAGDTPMEPLLIVEMAPLNVIEVPANAAKSEQVPIDTVSEVKRVAKSTQEPPLTMTDAEDQTWPSHTDLSESVTVPTARMLPIKMLDIPTVTVLPAYHQTFFDCAPFRRIINERLEVVMELEALNNQRASTSFPASKVTDFQELRSRVPQQ